MDEQSIGFSSTPILHYSIIPVSSEVSPQPPLLETNLCPIDKPRWSPGARLSSAKWRPARRISVPVCSGAARAESEQSYCMEPKIDRSTLSCDLNRQIMSHYVRLLMGNAT